MSNGRNSNNQGWWLALGLTALVSYNYGHSNGEKDGSFNYDAVSAASNIPADQAVVSADAAVDAAAASADMAGDAKDAVTEAKADALEARADAVRAEDTNTGGSILATFRPESRVTPPMPSTGPIALMSEPVSKDVYYANCSAARAAGDTPLYAGDPGYASRMDRDGDGVACE